MQFQDRSSVIVTNQIMLEKFTYICWKIKIYFLWSWTPTELEKIHPYPVVIQNYLQRCPKVYDLSPLFIVNITNEWSLTLTFKILNFESRMNWEKLCPNFNFTVENTKGNLHKVKLPRFKINTVYEICNFLEF